MSDAFDIHFKGIRIPSREESADTTPRLFWCPSCNYIFDAGIFLKYIQCRCENSNCIEIPNKEDIQKILRHVHHSKKTRITKEDLVEILI